MALLGRLKALGLGLAGLASPADAERVEARYAAFASIRAANDALAEGRGACGTCKVKIVAGTPPPLPPSENHWLNQSA